MYHTNSEKNLQLPRSILLPKILLPTQGNYPREVSTYIIAGHAGKTILTDNGKQPK